MAELIGALKQFEIRSDIASAYCGLAAEMIAFLEGRVIAEEAEVEHQRGHKEDYAAMLDTAEAALTALREENERLKQQVEGQRCTCPPPSFSKEEHEPRCPMAVCEKG